MKENNWAVKYSKGNGKGIDEIATEIEEEINSAKEDGIELNYNETEKFKSFNFEKQVELTGYIDALKRMKEYKEVAPEDAKLIDESFSKYKTGVFAARQQLFDAMENSKEKKELKTLENEISDLKSNKNKMQTYGKEMSKKADSLLVADLKKGAQEKALDMLTKARVEYRNKLNGWQRMWANILPTWMYGNGKYVDKINAYKKTLSEMGFTDKQIEKADPTKDPDYAYNKANGRYVKVKDNSNKAEEKEIEDDTSVKENDVKFILEGQTFTNGSIVPAKDNKTKQQDFQKGLAEVTGNNNKGDVSKTNQKTDNNPKLNNDIKK